MLSAFEQHTARLRGIERGELKYGEGSARDQALRFYIDKMLDEAVAHALTRSDRQPAGPVGLLISLAGFSPITTILAYRLLRPQRMLVIFSEGTASSIDVIAGHLVGPDGMRHSDLMYRPCTPTDPHGIYRAVKEELERHGQLGSEPYAIIDITGGRKVMSAAAALAAWQLKLDLCYVESDYDPERRQPVPGTDRLLILGNPTTLFGQQEMDAARQLFAGGAFGAAHQRYDELCESIAEPGRARFMRALSDLYDAWCAVDLAGLPARIEATELAMAGERHELTQATTRRVEGQLAFLRTLVAGDRNSLLVCFHVLGQHYQRVGRHDFAALFHYRTLEGCLARRLESRASGFLCSKPDYSLLTDDVDELTAVHAEVMAALGRPSRMNLPYDIGLISAAALLTALDDPLIPAAGLTGARALAHLQLVARTRNRSVLAHGYEPVAEDDCRLLEGKARSVLLAYWKLESGDEDFDEFCDRLRFVQSDH